MFEKIKILKSDYDKSLAQKALDIYYKIKNDTDNVQECLIMILQEVKIVLGLELATFWINKNNYQSTDKNFLNKYNYIEEFNKYFEKNFIYLKFFPKERLIILPMTILNDYYGNWIIVIKNNNPLNNYELSSFLAIVETVLVEQDILAKNPVLENEY